MKDNYSYLAVLILFFGLMACSNESNENSKNYNTDNSNIDTVSNSENQGNNNLTNDFIINGTINSGAGKSLTLQHYEANGPVTLDSTIVNSDGSFQIKIKSPTLDFYRMGFDQYNFLWLILSKEDNPVVLASADNLAASYKVTGSIESEIAHDLYAHMDVFKLYMDSITRVMQTYTTAEVDARKKTLVYADSIKLAFYNYLMSFIEEHPNSPVCISALEYLDPTRELETYKKIAVGLKATFSESQYYSWLMGKITETEQSFAQQKLLQQQQQSISQTLVSGAAAPEINLNNPEGKPIALSSLKGKVVLIDFWASWCKPCRLENPNVVRLYKKYHDKGFTVYSVSLDKDLGSWKNAIVQDGLIWPNHVSDLKFWSTSVIQTYKFNSIPFTVLIDKNGKIVDHNLRGAKLEAKLAEIFGE